MAECRASRGAVKSGARRGVTGREIAGVLQFPVPAPERQRPAGAPDARSLRGLLGRFVYRDEARGFGIASLQSEDGTEHWTLKGALWGLETGQCVEVQGAFEDDARWGRQFRVDKARPVLPSTAAGVVQFLRSAQMPGIGARLAVRIVERLGPDALTRVRSEPHLLATVPGLHLAKRKVLLAALERQSQSEATLVFLYGHAIGAALGARIAAQYGIDTIRKVRENPYRVADEVPGVGFRTADGLARALGVAADDPHRLHAAFRFSLGELAQQGHTAPPLDLVLERTADALDLGRDALQPHVAALCRGRGVVCHLIQDGETQQIARAELAQAEARLAQRLADMLRAPQPELSASDEAWCLAAAQAALGFSLRGTQLQAVKAVLHDNLVIVTGGPGTGKTTIIRGVLAALSASHWRIALAAPTGRAAHRMADATGQEAKTLHRLLEYDPRHQRFVRDQETPLDADLVIVDEVSMMDVPLAAALCDALRPGARLLLVGDADQLPSVGPGAVLDDLLRSGCVPCVALDHIYRQGEGSAIVANAHRVRHGEFPVSAPRGSESDFFIVPRESPDEVVAALLEIALHRLPRLGFHPVDDVQVLAPMRRGPLGTLALNEHLRNALNPHGAPVAGGLRVGDKVLQVKNDYDLEVFNGDIGRVIGGQGPAGQRQPALATEATVQIRFGDRDVQYPLAQIDQLVLAYAVTIHKSQGIEYPAIVAVLHAQHHVLLQRNLLYTALTRARRFAVLIGQQRAIERAVSNDAPIRRHTRLLQALRQAAKP